MLLAMKEPYSKGVANHADPESCAGGGAASGEALIEDLRPRSSSSPISVAVVVATEWGERLQGNFEALAGGYRCRLLRRSSRPPLACSKFRFSSSPHGAGSPLTGPARTATVARR